MNNGTTSSSRLIYATTPLVVDSTGLKVYGEGEWRVRQHGYSKRRTWRKVHLALDANSGQIWAVLMTLERGRL